MAIIETVDEARFREAFRKQGRHKYSRAGLHEIFRDLERISEGLEEDIELDLDQIGADYSEFDLDELVAEFRGAPDLEAFPEREDDMDDNDYLDAIAEVLEASDYRVIRFDVDSVILVEVGM